MARFSELGLLFMGEFEVAIDEKHRIMIPAKWKPMIGQEIVICEGFEGAIELRTKPSFVEYYSKLSAHDSFTVHARKLKRRILGTSREIVLDKWGRFVIPVSFNKEGRNFKGSLMMIGNGDSIEIWDKKQYQEWTENEENTVEKAAEALAASKVEQPASND